jgi:hypothetical protein
METQYENDCVKVVQSYGFNVDKEELQKAFMAFLIEDAAAQGLQI